MKKLYFGTNLKMYKNMADTAAYLQRLQELTRDIPRDEIELFVLPSYTSLNAGAACVDPQYITLGAQNMAWEEQGQFTGEVSPLMLQEMGIRLVMIGHSERRHVFGETDQKENLKVLAAVNHGFTALLCIGETLEEKSFGVSDEILRMQLKIGLFGLPAEKLAQLWVAYEPVWAIGVGGTPATADYAQARHQAIRTCLEEMYGTAGRQIPLLYGGSVNPGNASEMIVLPSVDGLFTGRSAWQADGFNQLIRGAKAAFEANAVKTQ
jgi:L-erythrulose 1-phosphate isomerase